MLPSHDEIKDVKNTPFFSVITAAYRAKPFLHRYFQTLSNQTICDFEIILSIRFDSSKEKNLYELINELYNPDIVIVEGFKNEAHAKIEIIKNPEDPSSFLFPRLTNIIGIISNKKIDTSIRQFKKNEIDKIAKHILILT